MVTLAAIAVLVVAPAAQSKTITCRSGHVCKGTFEPIEDTPDFGDQVMAS
jgi:hypothetical protein